MIGETLCGSEPYLVPCLRDKKKITSFFKMELVPGSSTVPPCPVTSFSY